MKKLNLVLTFAVLFVSQNSAMGAVSSNYDKGFCVPFGKELILENAVFNSEDHYFLSKGHRFFDFENGVTGLFHHDWGGKMKLAKIAGDLYEGQNLAVFKDESHIKSPEEKIREAMLVQCVVVD